MKKNNKKGFTIVELIVVMAIIGILVLLAVPKFMGHTKEATFTKLIANTKTLETASERYYMDKNEWPRLSDEAYTSDEIEAFAKKIYDATGKEITLDSEGSYYDIDFNKLQRYVNVPDNKEYYIIQNPVGNVYALEGLTEEAKTRITVPKTEAPKEEGEEPLYEFTTFTFTNAEQIGTTGPTQSQLNNAYSGTLLESKVNSLDGIQLWTVPTSGYYRIETYGAKAADVYYPRDKKTCYGGSGSIVSAEIYLEKGTQLKILVGQMSIENRNTGSGNYASGGAGGTFVSTSDNIPLIVAGGGGGAVGVRDYCNGKNATTTTSGAGTSFLGGTNGNVGSGTNGGGGFYTGGENSSIGKSFISGGNGLGYGGFGGGGNGGGYTIGSNLYSLGGGGGGYSGGAGGHHSWSSGYAGGGGSYITADARNVETSDGAYDNSSIFNEKSVVNLNQWNTSHGKVVITHIGK